jgi:mannose-6-phosphate isomerase-like protein (cupin superfamily)
MRSLGTCQMLTAWTLHLLPKLAARSASGPGSLSGRRPRRAGESSVPEICTGPFELAKWTVAPGTANDHDVHRSREVSIVVAGAAIVVLDDNKTTRLQHGYIMALESRTPASTRQ